MKKIEKWIFNYVMNNYDNPKSYGLAIFILPLIIYYVYLRYMFMELNPQC
jgi:hypothetical protein